MSAGVMVVQASREFGIWHGVALMSARVCCRCVVGFFWPEADEARSGGTRLAPPCSHQVEGEARHFKKSAVLVQGCKSNASTLVESGTKELPPTRASA